MEVRCGAVFKRDQLGFFNLKGSNHLSSNIHRLLLERNRQNKSTHELIKLNGMISIRAKRSKDLVAHLAKVVAGQQLSTKAADSIWKKIETLLEENNCSIEELFLAKPAALRASSGLSVSYTHLTPVSYTHLTLPTNREV